jgi:transcriptional regulator with XRE-family HTH domain
MQTSTFCQRLRQLHEETELSQDQAVEMIKKRTGYTIHQTTFSAIMRGANQPTLPVLLALAKAYRVNLEWLAGTANERTPVDELSLRVAELSLPEEVERAAKLMAQLPPEQQRRWGAIIEGEYKEREERKHNAERWERLSRIVSLMDKSGDLRARIEAETGISLSSGN